MLNHYPLWKYITLIFFLLVSLLYALPNLYGDDPAIQVTGVHGRPIHKNMLIQIQDELKNNNIQTKSITLENGVITARFSNANMQLRARELILKYISSVTYQKYIVALNLFPATPLWLKKIFAKPIKLGLDLRGGVHFLMEVDIETIINKLQKQNIDNFSREFNSKNINYSRMFKNNDDLLIFFNQSNTLNKGFKYLTDHHIDLNITRNGSNALRIKIKHDHLLKMQKYIIEKNINILRKRINQLGIADALIQSQGFNRIIVELPGIQDTAQAKEILGTTATLEFRLVNSNVNTTNLIKGRIPSNSEVKKTTNGQLILLYKSVILTGDHITDSTASTDEYNQPQVDISLDNYGGEIMSNFTKNHIGKTIATLLVEYKDSRKKNSKTHSIFKKNEEIINLANIQSRIGNNFRITGINSLNEAHQLSLLLRAGALTAPMRIIEERIIGPSIGYENISKGLKSCLWGLIVSIVFMISYYRKFGLIATTALLANLILIVGIMSVLPGATLTMPGIAGILLTLAFAVDANVLINERIKEELKNGYSVQNAIYKGYNEAFSSIVDANMTTLITSIILYVFGTGSIKGFAIATAIGVLTSMLTAIVFTRAIVNLFYGRKKGIKNLSI